MKGIYLINYSVKGIKALDEWIHLSFYKKSIKKGFSIQNYNVKGIYGTNGAGKSGIMSSMKILRSLILDITYLSNPLIQKQLDEIVNKKTKRLEYEVDFLIHYEDGLRLYNYKVKLGKNDLYKWEIIEESLHFRKPTSHREDIRLMFEVKNSEIKFLSTDNEMAMFLTEQTKNLLSSSTLCSITVTRTRRTKEERYFDVLIESGILFLSLFGLSIFVYLDSEDDHTDYFINEMVNQERESEQFDKMFELLEHKGKLTRQLPRLISVTSMSIPEKDILDFEEQVAELENFLKIFKKNLQKVEIERKKDKNRYWCELVMNYGDYSVNAEFESTGIKKLVRLFSYLQKMVEGNIVFIDELDSNLHDVYLCALLEYLMEYGKGQLCFTTHNIGPMDVLKRNKNSIDFLSVDKKIYSWTKNGNYSPSKLYRNGMIEGSPFNIESFDFVGAFSYEEGDE